MIPYCNNEGVFCVVLQDLVKFYHDQIIPSLFIYVIVSIKRSVSTTELFTSLAIHIFPNCTTYWLFELTSTDSTKISQSAPFVIDQHKKRTPHILAQHTCNLVPFSYGSIRNHKHHECRHDSLTIFLNFHSPH